MIWNHQKHINSKQKKIQIFSEVLLKSTPKQAPTLIFLDLSVSKMINVCFNFDACITYQDKYSISDAIQSSKILLEILVSPVTRLRVSYEVQRNFQWTFSRDMS